MSSAQLALATALLLLPLSSAARPLRYLGITSSTYAGNAGLAAMNTDCAATYGMARVCTDVEVFNTLPFPTPDTDAWILAEDFIIDEGGTDFLSKYGLRFEAPSSMYGMNCSFSPTGLFATYSSSIETIYLTSGGEFAVTTCGASEMPAACCGL